MQAAVVEAAHAGRDLLVSSETGSGKTLAFGIAIAAEVLEGTGVRGLVVTPTRELAAQVREELGWLYGKTKLRFVVCTGGTDVRGDLDRLRRGADVVVGTPGRLVDLVKRGSLKLEGVQAVVLDEADEMLDMGFREDLETLLAARADAPDAERGRTLMFSATLPPAILGIAARFQRDAVRVDTRARGGQAGAHADISYVAHLVAMGERVPAVVNVLRKHRGVRTIVFGTTRDGVADLHQQLVNRGFRAVVLSGDRVQAERTRALTALRDGDADVLVATNVAARGLDLPEVDLVIHADLPLNAEALTHRSGRTGRAGRKGTSVIIATLADRRKAERLLGMARVPFTWTAAPDEREIARAAEGLLAEELRGEAAAADGDDAADARELAGRLGAEVDGGRDALLVALLRRELQRMPRGERLTPVDLRARHDGTRDRAMRGAAGRRDLSRGAVVFRVNIGRQQKAEPGWLLPLICRRGGVTRHDVGAIRVGPMETEFEIAGDAADDFALAASQTDPRAPHVRFQRDGRPGPAPSARPAPHAERPAQAEEQPAPAPHRPAPHAERKPRHERPTPQIERRPAPRIERPAARPPHGEGPPKRSSKPGAWRPPGGPRPPGPHKAGNRRPPRPRA
ncbi:MAG TPA: DEAD/DEAH box helicase [Polyangia bacterium]|nr:DEAD/DEAH box helicase [Polyangia bacterium]